VRRLIWLGFPPPLRAPGGSSTSASARDLLGPACVQSRAACHYDAASPWAVSTTLRIPVAAASRKRSRKLVAHVAWRVAGHPAAGVDLPISWYNAGRPGPRSGRLMPPGVRRRTGSERSGLHDDYQLAAGCGRVRAPGPLRGRRQADRSCRSAAWPCWPRSCRQLADRAERCACLTSRAPASDASNDVPGLAVAFHLRVLPGAMPGDVA
jgi:hypothetical protein